MIPPKRPKVAVIGSGISGLSAAWALHRTKAYEVHIYEAEDRLGGHTNTVDFVHEGATVPVDTGFIVLNAATYRTFSTPASAGAAADPSQQPTS